MMRMHTYACAYVCMHTCSLVIVASTHMYDAHAYLRVCAHVCMHTCSLVIVAVPPPSTDCCLILLKFSMMTPMKRLTAKKEPTNTHSTAKRAFEEKSLR